VDRAPFSLPLASSFETEAPLALPEYERISKAASRSHTSPPANLKVIEENEAKGEVATLYERFRMHFGRSDVPGILKCFATHPPLLRHMMDLSESLIFADGHLSRRHKEMIATMVSVENACDYCADSHGFFFRTHGGSAEALCAIQDSQIESPSLAAAERALLRFVQKVNRSSSELRRADIELLNAQSWTDAQVAEVIHIAALFSFFNRVANSFGLESQGLLSLFEHESSVLDFADVDHEERSA
jgi:uncharacterized peroxidase-related enzyme